MTLPQIKDIKTPPPEDASTPLMSQYLTIKAQHPTCLLFFRLGDFYEMFFEDAVTAAHALDITLTSRGQMNGENIPMCGVPFHAYEGYLVKLIRKGFHVALCEQTEAPAEAKKRGAKSIVTREVVRIVTPGTVTEDALLSAQESNYLVCVAQTGQEIGLAWLDLASGQPYAEKVTVTFLDSALARINASEVLTAQKIVENIDLLEKLSSWREKLTVQPNARFESENAKHLLLKTYGVGDLSAFGDFSRAEITALGALIDYVSLTQKSDLSHLKPPRSQSPNKELVMDSATRRNLELTRTLSGEKKGSLLAAIDRTITSAGARLLASRVTSPLTDVGLIKQRLDAVSFFVARKKMRNFMMGELSHTPDLERALARLSLSRGGPRDLAAVRDALKKAEVLRSKLLACNPKDLPHDLTAARQGLGQHTSLQDKLTRALKESLPLLSRDGGFIARGYSAGLDKFTTLRDNSRQLTVGLQQKYAAAAKTPSLKIKHNNMIGYHVVVPPSHAEKLLAQKDLFIHRQTLVSGVRFTTVELGELEQKISQAADKALALELQLFESLVKEISAQLPELRRTAESLAEIDVTAALAELAGEQNYCRPEIDQSLTFKIKDGRHPVVAQFLSEKADGSPFISNSCDLGSKQNLWLLTGPNMAGKSTFLRQNALIAILAQTGSFVPAKAAHMGVIDRLFSRVGAADDLARGQSTFMVEMVETAAILNQASKNSLVILDEIGRGTATYDGLSIAWATIEHLHEVNHCRTLFATHYHELTQLSKKMPRLFCATMKIKEWKKEIIFLHEVAPGTADRSYGIHVAQMAGIPKSVISRAEMVLQQLETGKTEARKASLVDNLPLFSSVMAKEDERNHDSPVLESIRGLKPDEMTPMEALKALYNLKEKMS